MAVSTHEEGEADTMTKARFDEIKQHFGQEHAGGLRTETIAAAKDLIAEVEARGKFEQEFERESNEAFEQAQRDAAPMKAAAAARMKAADAEDDAPDVRRTSGARKK
jgi:hypothetical protein